MLSLLVLCCALLSIHGSPTYREDLFEGDIMLTPKQKIAVKEAIRKQESLESAASTYGLTNVYPPWKNGVVVYSFAYSMGASQQRAVRAAMHEWTTKTGGCITFRRRTTEKNYVEFHVGNGCWGHLGQPNGKSQVSVGPNCDHQHVMSHEIGHVLGFWHEQSRPDRDSYLQVLWQNVPGQFREAFAKYGRDKIDSLGVPFDYTSIMQYPWNAFSTTGRDTLRPLRTVPNPGPYKRISPSDVQQVKLFYKCSGGGRPPTRAPATGVPPRTFVPPVTKCVEGGVDPNCQDKHHNCASWASRGECTKNPAYMKVNCCKSCKAGTDSSCVDSNKNCASWARNGECDKNPDWMHPNCKKSCGKCGSTKCATTAAPRPPTRPPRPPTRPPTKAPTAPPSTAAPTQMPPPPPTGLPPTKPPVPATCDSSVPAGVADKAKVPDGAMSASSTESPSHAAHFGRLGNKADSSSVGAWCAAVSDNKQYLQVEFQKTLTITGIKTQGRAGAHNKHVSKYKLSSSLDGETWHDYNAGADVDGNSDSDSVKEVKLDIPLLGKFVRIIPTAWNHMICMRVELMVCA